MELRELENVEVKYFLVTKKRYNGLSEEDCFNQYKELGFNVFTNYTHLFRNRGKHQPRDYEKETRRDLRRLGPSFSKEVTNLFKKYKTGYPDLLLERNGRWEFIEVKTTNDALKPNQIVFLEQLAKHAKVSIHLFIDTEDISSYSKKRKDRGNKMNYDSKGFRSTTEYLVNKQKTKGFKEYYVVAQLFKTFPGFDNNPSLVDIVTSLSSLTSDNVKWYVNMNRSKLSKDAVRKITNKSRITDRDLLIIREHKKNIR